MNTKVKPDLTVSGPAGMVSIIPHLCGFIPNESLILVWMTDRRISLTQRIDVDVIDENTDAIYDAIKAGATHGPTEVAAILWTDRDGLRFIEAATRVAKAIERTEVYLLDVLAVRDDRWRSLTCGDPTCCPPEGHAIDHYSPEVATMTTFGSAPLPDREATIVDLTPTSEARTQAPVYKRPADLTKWRKRVTDAPERLTPADLAGALHDVRVRDTLLWDAMQEGATEEWEALFAEATRASHPDDSAPAATCFAITRWLRGGGAATTEALHAAIKVDPDYALAGMVGFAISKGLPPSAWSDAMSALTRDDCLHGRS